VPHKTEISYPIIFAPMFRHNNAILNRQETHFDTKLRLHWNWILCGAK